MPSRIASKTYGTVSADRQKEMSGLEFVQGLVDGTLPLNTIAQTLGYAIQSTLEKGVGQTTLEFKISLVRPITAETGPIKAEGIVLSRGRRVGTAEGRVTDGQGRLLAHGTTTCLIFPS
jgi:uncharacterized protein (TIGR00369 family)